jgi:hypothetical protein
MSYDPPRGANKHHRSYWCRIRIRCCCELTRRDAYLTMCHLDPAVAHGLSRAYLASKNNYQSHFPARASRCLVDEYRVLYTLDTTLSACSSPTNGASIVVVDNPSISRHVQLHQTISDWSRLSWNKACTSQNSIWNKIYWTIPQLARPCILTYGRGQPIRPHT